MKAILDVYEASPFVTEGTKTKSAARQRSIELLSRMIGSLLFCEPSPK